MVSNKYFSSSLFDGLSARQVEAIKSSQFQKSRLEVIAFSNSKYSKRDILKALENTSKVTSRGNKTWRLRKKARLNRKLSITKMTYILGRRSATKNTIIRNAPNRAKETWIHGNVLMGLYISDLESVPLSKVLNNGRLSTFGIDAMIKLSESNRKITPDDPRKRSLLIARGKHKALNPMEEKTIKTQRQRQTEFKGGVNIPISEPDSIDISAYKSFKKLHPTIELDPNDYSTELDALLRKTEKILGYKIKL